MFSWGKTKKTHSPGNSVPGSILPAATRDITSSHGTENRAPSVNSGAAGTGTGARDFIEKRPAVATTPQPAQKLNGSTSQIVLPARMEDSSAPRAGRDRSESDITGIPQRTIRMPPVQAESPYPWSHRRLNFTGSLSPLPRYGAAINATASRWIYIMGGLVNSQTVKGDLWMIDLTNGAMTCYALNTVAEGPGPRVGHASLLVGNAFIVFGGDTKLDDGDVLDDTLYLLNTSSKQWARASPSGPRPAGRYGHTLNILGSKIYIFGGQVEGYFFNDLVAFDLNTLQVAGNRWEILVPNNHDDKAIPAPRTNHSVVSWQDKLYLFGGTDGSRWFNDVWTYDPSENAWTELDCIGYIPAAREGHAAALVNDTMYIFGGRIQDGTDLGDLVAFKISTKRWYMFQNMGTSPSPRSGHSMTAYGNHIIVLAGEPSSAPRDVAELSQAYILDTTKIRYPTNDISPSRSQQGQVQLSGQTPQQSQTLQQQNMGPRTYNNDRSPLHPSLSTARTTATTNGLGSENQQQTAMRLAQLQIGRNSGTSTPALQNKVQDLSTVSTRAGSRSGSRADSNTLQDKDSVLSTTKFAPQTVSAINGVYRSASQLKAGGSNLSRNGSRTDSQNDSRTGSRNDSRTGSRTGSRPSRQQSSVESDDRDTPRPSVDANITHYSREVDAQIDSGVGSSPALGRQQEELLKELEATKTRNVWYASELSLARKSGYQTSSLDNSFVDPHSVDNFSDEDKPLIEALLKMRAELLKIQGSIDEQSEATATRIAEVEKQRDIAISEAIYAKAKLAAHGGSSSHHGTPQSDGVSGSVSPELDRANDMSKRLAIVLGAKKELNARLEVTDNALELEKRARILAEAAAEAAERRITELDMYKHASSTELAGLRAELHEAQRIAREESAKSAEANAAMNLLKLDKSELVDRHSTLFEDQKSHATVLQTLREAVLASTQKADHLEHKVEEERQIRISTEQKFMQYRIEHEQNLSEFEDMSRRLEDLQTLADKNAEEAKTHRDALLFGIGAVTSRPIEETDMSNDRAAVLTRELESAQSIARRNQDFADAASEKLSRAEERIAGLEAYQEQTNRENLAMRKQTQQLMKEGQALQTDKTQLSARLESSMLDSNALEVQLKTLKNLLEERGISAAEARRSRILESPGSRYGTPDMNRIGDLQRQLDEAVKSHDELRSTFEDREQQLSREWESKLTALSEEHNGTIKYVRGLEKIFNKMKPEVQRYKVTIQELEKELALSKTGANGSRSMTDDKVGHEDWQVEQSRLKQEASDAQDSLKTMKNTLESQIATLKNSLSDIEVDRQKLLESSRQSELQMRGLHDKTNSELDMLRRDKKHLETRATDAEQKLQIFLDQFEHSVDNYKRMSRMEQQGVRALGIVNNKSGSDYDSIYNTATIDDFVPSEETENEANKTSRAKSVDKQIRDRNSTALDTLTSELESLRSKWETTRGNYKLNERYDYDERPNSFKQSQSPSLNTNKLPSWVKALHNDTDSNGNEEPGEKVQSSTLGQTTLDRKGIAPRSVPADTK